MSTFKMFCMFVLCAFTKFANAGDITINFDNLDLIKHNLKHLGTPVAAGDANRSKTNSGSSFQERNLLKLEPSEQKGMIRLNQKGCALCVRQETSPNELFPKGGVVTVGPHGINFSASLQLF